MKLLTKLFGRQFHRRIIASLLAYVMFLNALVPVTIAGPEGAQVVNGQVSIQQSGSNTAITASDKAIINYSSFDIARPETVRFIQPGSNASVLNRILSANPTNIDGTILANGRIFFVNPAGVYIGDGARINVNQFVASALNISNSDFINGNYDFAGGNGAVINDGDISAEQVYLIGKQVTNSGNISCPAGYVVMAAGDRVFIGEPGSDIILEVEGTSLSESADAAISETGVLNEGTIDAAGGIIALAAAGDIYSQAISNVGSLSTSADTGDGGQIMLAAAGGEVVNTGTIEASGSEGGQVAMEGARVGQFGTIHADGTTGDGGNVDLKASDVVALGSDSLTTANAGTNGNGGEVIVYSPDTALFRTGARIEAKGGSESGNGGFVEVSGKEHVEVFGSVDTTAPEGATGMFLIDPYNITISSSATSGGDWTPPGHPTTFTSTSDSSTLLVNDLKSNLENNNISVVTGDSVGGQAGDITVADPINYADAGITTYNDLTLEAHNDIIVNADITTGTHDLTLIADSDSLGGGNVSINAAINMTTGNFTSSGVNFASNSSGTITTTGGNVDLSGHTGAVDIDAAISAAGSVDIAGSSINISSDIAGVGISLGNAVTADGAGLQTIDAGTSTLAAGDITKTTAGTLMLGGNAGLNLGGDVRATAAGGNLTFTDNVTVNGTGGQVLDAEDGTLTVNDGFNITKTTVGTLTLGGNTALNLGGDVRATAAGGNLTFTDNVTINGTGGQVLDAEDGTLTANDGVNITKTTAGTLTLGGNAAVNLGGDVRATAAGGNLTFADNVTFNGTGGQVLDAENGTLTMNSGINITKTTAGTLTLGGNAAVNLGGDVRATAAGGNLAFTDNVTVNGAGGQVMDAEDGTLTANDGVNITKNTAGVLTLGGNSAVNLGGDVRATGAGSNLTFADNVTLNGTGGQVLDAVDGTLMANDGVNIIKNTAGTLTLGGNTAVNLAGDVRATAAGGNLIFADNVTVNGTGGQILDAENGTLTVNSGIDITKTTAGTLTLGGNTALNLGGDVRATGAGGNLTFADNVTANGTGGQVLDAEDGTLTSNDGVNITKTTAGTLTLGGRSAINLGGDVRATVVGGNLTFADNVTLNGTGGQVLDAENGTLIMSGINITKTTAGTLALGSNAGLNIDDNVMATNAGGNLAIEDNATIADGITLQAGNDIMVAAGKTLKAEGDLTLVATNGGISEKAGDDGKVQIDMTLDNQTLALTENDDVSMSGFSVINDEHTNLVIDSKGSSAIVSGSAADDWLSITAAAQYNVVLSGDGDITTGNLESRFTGGSTGVQIYTDTGSGGGLDAQGTINSGGFVTVDVEGTASFDQPISAEGKVELTAKGDITTNAISSTAGNIEILSTGGDLIVEGSVNADANPFDGIGGGVSLISETGKIYTPDGVTNDTLNVDITGYSMASGAGINLPFGPDKTAILIMSKDDLKLGTNTTLTANGEYSISVDDRPGVGFDISPSVGGEPIDVAIYLRSFRSDPPPSTPSDPGGHVAVKSKVTIADYGTMVVDAGEKVTFEEKFNESEFYQTNRLEVVSRRSETLEAVILNNLLPYAKNPEAIREWFNETPTGYFAGAYVLRGAKTVLAEVLDLANPVPLALPRPLEPEFQGEVERPDTGALEELLNELGIGVQPYVTDAYAASLSTDLRLYSAAEKLQQLIPVLEDADGTRIAGLRTTVAQFFPSLDVLSEERMDSFAQELTRHKGDGSDYDLAGQCIFALIEYVNILGTDIGWPVEKSVGFVMGRYVPRLTEGDEIRIAVIQMQLQKALGV